MYCTLDRNGDGINALWDALLIELSDITVVEIERYAGEGRWLILDER
jgi:hypothetical protein